MHSKDRELNMRRDIYLEAIEAISAGINAVGQFSDIHVTMTELMKSYTEKIASVAKVTLIGSDETIEAVLNFSQELTGPFMRLTAKRQRLDSMQQQRRAIQEKIDVASRSQERILAQITEQHKPGAYNQKWWNELQRQLALEQERIDRLTEGRSSA